MPLVGIIANKNEAKMIRDEIRASNIEIIEIKSDTIENLKNIKFDEIIFMKDINLKEKTYKFMKDIISKVEYLIINEDIDIEILKAIKLEKPVKLITFGFNQKATITISSIKDNKMVICLQRNIKSNNKLIETQEKEIEIYGQKSKKIYNNLVVFIIKELHNV